MSCGDKLGKRLVCTLGFIAKGYDYLLLLLFPFSSVIITVLNPKIYGSNHSKVFYNNRTIIMIKMIMAIMIITGCFDMDV